MNRYEVFHHPHHCDISEHGESGAMPHGWYYWYCQPGCLPDSDPIGPFDGEDEAELAVQEEIEENS